MKQGINTSFGPVRIRFLIRRRRCQFNFTLPHCGIERPFTARDGIQGRYVLTQLIAVDPEIGQHAFHEVPRFKRWDAFDKKDRIIQVLGVSFPFPMVPRTAVPRHGQLEQVIRNIVFLEQHFDIALPQFQIGFGCIQLGPVFQFHTC